MHPDDDDSITCADCSDTGRIVYGRIDRETVDAEDCTCAAGRRRIAARAPLSLAGRLARSVDIVVASKGAA